MMRSIRELEDYTCTLYDTRDQLKKYVFDRSDRAFAAGDEARDRICSQEELRNRQRTMKEALLTSLGGLPNCVAPLNARTTRIVQGEGYGVENLIFESRPKDYVTANLYIPDGLEKPTGAVLFLCGHEYEGKHSPYYHEVCLRFVQAGLIVLAMDPIGQGERLSGFVNRDGTPLWGTAEHQRLGVQAHLLGESVARYFVHDAMRAIDYLQSRPEVNPACIGVTGNSGGGTQTALMMVCDERIAAAAPGTFIMNRQEYMHAGGVQDGEQVWVGLSAEGFDHEDLLLCFVPKPLLVLACTSDFFPIEGTRRTVSRASRFWSLLGEPGRIELVEDASTHRFTDSLAIAAAEFFSQELLGKKCYVDAERRLKPLSPKELMCTETGGVCTSFPDATTLYARNRQEFKKRRAESAGEWLQARVMQGRQPCDFNTRRINLGTVGGLDVEYLLWWSQPGLMNSGYLFQGRGQVADGHEAVAIGLWPGGTTALEDSWTWVDAMCQQHKRVFVLNCSGMGPHTPHAIYGKPPHGLFGVMHKLTDDLLWLGDSLAALRIYDLLRCLDMLEAEFGPLTERVELRTQGRYALYGMLGSLLDARLGLDSETPGFDVIEDFFSPSLAEEELMTTVFPGVLKYLDLNEWKGR